MHLDLFKTRIWKYNSGSNYFHIKKDVEDLISKDPGRQISNIGSWQSSGTLAYKDNFKELLNYVKTMATEPIVQYGIDTLNIEISINDVWANMNPKNGFNMPHDHCGDFNFLSFVYYLQTNLQNNFISFKTEMPSTKFINLPKSKDTELNSDDVVVSVEPGDLIIFPSWIEHYTLPNPTDDMRISIAGNIQIKTK